MLNRVVRRYSPAHLVGAAAVLLALAGSSASAQVRWRSGAEAVGPALQGEALRARMVELAGRNDRSRLVIAFDEPVTPAQRAQLAGAGVNLLGYIGSNTYFARIDGAGLDAARAQAAARVRTVAEISTHWKLHPDLIAARPPAWSIVNANAAPGKPGEALDPAQAKGDPTIAVYVLFHQDVDPATAGKAAVERAGGTVRTLLRGLPAAVVHAPLSRIDGLASADEVQYIEPPLPAMSEVNSENRAITGANVVNSAPYGLDGSGVTVMVYDGGTVRATHQDLAGRVTIGDTDGVSDHATHVMGTIGGTGVASGGLHRGMAPGVDFVSYGFEVDGGLQPGFLYTDPGDFEDDYTEAQQVFGAVLTNNSIGSNVEPNGYPCVWQGDYGLMGALIDAMVRGDTTGEPQRVVWAAGNERQGSACDIEGFGDFYSIAPPGGAKNHLSVGALNANDDSMTSFSSWGPTDDGRLKPDVSAPGCQSGGDGGVTSCGSGSDTSYSSKCGTSMASPTVCGLAALLLQDYRENFPDLPDFRNSMLRAVFAHTAVDRGNVGPDYQFGYGSVRIEPAVNQLRSGNFFEDQVGGTGQSYFAVLIVQPGQTELRATLAWDDAPGAANVVDALVNDLDLVLTSPTGVRHYPWTLNPASPNSPAVRNAEDHLNTIEQVLVDNPETGSWLIEVRGTNVPAGPQPFSLVASPLLINCSDAGVIAMNGASFACDAAPTVKVIDCGLNADAGVAEQVSVNVASGSQPAGVSVLLTETGADTSTFTGLVQFAASSTPGALLVAHGDTVTATYTDSDTGGGSPGIATDIAAIDCQAPGISAVATVDVMPRSARVTFTTTEPASPTVRVGTSCGSLLQTFTSNGVGTSHSVNLTNLTDNTAYHFEVLAVDDAGNVGVSDNGGACFTFNTPEIPDYFTQNIAGPTPLSGKTLTLTPVPSIDGYVACLSDAFALPTDPAGGNIVTFPSTQDDQFVQVNLTGGQTAVLYGVQHAGVFISSNGYVTFGSGDTDYSNEDYDNHFEVARVAAVYDDLHPGQGGQVSWKQLSDRFVASWVGVPQYNGGDSNTFQIELLFDGRIRMTWLDIDSQDHLVGLSRGLGTPVDFYPSDFGQLGSCGPTAPIALGGSAATPASQALTIALPYFDDGLPSGGAFGVTIRSLPDNARLRDPGTNSLILSVPHLLAGGGESVEFIPLGAFQGNTSFSYSVNDGGMPPSGGESNTATFNVMVGGPQIAYEFLVDNTNPGWTMEPDWAFGDPTGSGGDPQNGFTGNNVLGYNLNGQYPNSLNPARKLTSTAIDCTGFSQTRIEFRRWLGIESSSYDHAAFQVSNNGTTWTTVWDHSGPTMVETAWSLQSYDVSAIADGQPTVYLRWTMGTTDSSVTYSGWNLDDIRVWAVVPVTICRGDANGDGAADFGDLNLVLSNWELEGATLSQGDLTDDGLVNFDDLNEVLLVFGQSCF